MSKMDPSKPELPRREREVMDVVFANEKVSVADVQAALPDSPTYSATRMLLQRLYKKGLLTIEREGPKYIYSASIAKTTAGQAAWARLVKTFFNDSPANAFSALLGPSTETLSDEDLAELERLVADAKERRR